MKETKGGKGLFYLICSVNIPLLREGRTWSRDHGGVLLSGLISLLPYFSSSSCPGVALSTSVSQENAPQTCPQANLIKAISQLRLTQYRCLQFLSNGGGGPKGHRFKLKVYFGGSKDTLHCENMLPSNSSCPVVLGRPRTLLK